MYSSFARNFTYVLFSFLLILFSSSANAWWDCNWKNRFIVTVTNNSSPISNYVLEAKFNSSQIPSYLWNNLDNDLRAVDTNDLTQLKFFVVPRVASNQEVTVFVQIPNLPSGNKYIFLYYNNSSTTSASNPVGIFANGIRFHTKLISSTDAPVNASTTYSSWMNIFSNAAPGVNLYGCKIINDLSNFNNQQANGGVWGGGAADNYHQYLTTILSSNQNSLSINWGADLGFGGGAYSNRQIIQERYGQDLWWRGFGVNITGNATRLNSPFFYLEFTGSESCCSDVNFIQINNVNVTTSNFTLYAPPCPNNSVNYTVSNETILTPTIIKTVSVVSDPINNNLNPKIIPGSKVRFTLNVNNFRATLDNNTLSIVDPIPNQLKFSLANISANSPVQFIDGNPSSGLIFSNTNISYSNNGGTTFTYTPVSDSNNSDANINVIKISPSGSFQCSLTNNGNPNFSLIFDAVLK